MARPASRTADARPALLSVVALMLLLLPFLLLTTSVQKLAGIDLRLAGSAADLPPEPPGAVENLSVWVDEDASLRVTAQVRRSDLGAGQGETEARSERIVPSGERLDLVTLQSVLRRYKELDPERTRATLIPADSLSNSQVVDLMDAMRRDGSGDLYPLVTLGVQQPVPPSPASEDTLEPTP